MILQTEFPSRAARYASKGGQRFIQVYCFLDTYSRSAIRNSIRTLSLSAKGSDTYTKMPLADLATILMCLPALRTLLLRNIFVPFDSIPELAVDEPRYNLRSLRRLVCAYHSKDKRFLPMRNPADMVASLALFTAIEEVVIYAEDDFKIGMSGPHDRIGPCQIESLTVNDGTGLCACLLTVMENAMDTSWMHTLKLYVEDAKMLGDMKEALERVAPGLQSFTLEVEGFLWRRKYRPDSEDLSSL